MIEDNFLINLFKPHHWAHDHSTQIISHLPRGKATSSPRDTITRDNGVIVTT